MEIIRSAKDKEPKKVTTDCHCGCTFRFASSEAKFVAGDRDGAAYKVKCPECKAKLWVDASLFC